MLLLWNLNEINYADTLIGVVIALFQAVLILVLTNILLNRIWMKSTSMGKNLFDYGVDKISIKDGRLSKTDKKQMFGIDHYQKPYELCYWFITGDGFIKDYFQLLVDAIKNGCKIKILLHDPKSNHFYDERDPYTIEIINRNESIKDKMADYYFNIVKGNLKDNQKSFGDRIFAMYMLRKILDNNSNQININDYDDGMLKKIIRDSLTKRGDHTAQIVFVQKLINEIKKESGVDDGIEVRYYADEYRSTVMIAKYLDEKNKQSKSRCWVNFASPMTAAQDSITLSSHPRKENKKNIDDNDTSQFLKDMENSFDYIWNQYKN